MLIDHRTYRIKPGAMQAHLDIYEQYGFAVQTRHLGKPVAYMFTESGELNTIVHVWAYDNAGDREQKRAAMAADPEWQTYLKKNREAGYLEHQVTKLMIPAKFAPIIR
ncbi:NIPSNAP family protein [Pseudorhodoplanes sp.]|uniref:NIPSNAP family protein n=1 Tax=Pseudorhodoplanes sp. TaxID=1934341 RepID=UPI002D11534F|nr:NIPSNAP family protein [Pseudorhodoplanes sp.]HWV51468.1 NIPSNAP family protein [Pseudorhodoplanes sp.]